MKLFYTTIFLLIATNFYLVTTTYGQVPSPATISMMAVYKAQAGVTDSIPDNLVNYNITSPVLINSMISGIESDTLRNCDLLESDNSAFLYVKFLNNTRSVYHLFLNWSHFSKKNDRPDCYYVAPSSQALFKGNAQ